MMSRRQSQVLAAILFSFPVEACDAAEKNGETVVGF
jgi:hypothetical protein